MATPVLFGRRAADLTLDVPETPWDELDVPTVGGLTGFPPQPPHFVGRVGVMAKAGAALAPRSGRTGVLFHGMSGAGKSACAIELSYQYEDLKRFTGFVWYQAPPEGSEVAGSLAAFATAFETQLSDENLRSTVPAGRAGRGRGRQVRRLPAPAPRFPDEAERAAGPGQPGDPAPPRRRLDRPAVGEGRRDAAGPRGR